MKRYARDALAISYGNRLKSDSMLEDLKNGLFLAGARRTGKSWFLKDDLQPQMAKQGWLVIYVDLWKDLKTDPAELVANAIGEAYAAHLGGITKAVQASGMDSVGAPGLFKIDLKKIGRPDGVTLADALLELHAQSKKRIALIIDEAQHALTSDAGEACMFALKAARDHLNSGVESRLRLIFSGSHQDKLLRLLNTPAAPFWGSRVELLETLGSEFVRWYAVELEREDPTLAPIDTSTMAAAFDLLGNRPQDLINTVQRAHRSLGQATLRGQRLGQATLAQAKAWQKEEFARMGETFRALEDLERAVLERLFATGANFRPYDAGAMAFYAAKLTKKPTAVTVQRKLEALQKKDVPLVWKSARSDYALYDQSLQDWYNFEVNRGAWPPT